MAWVTPKTNWTLNDYYNLEDANRISKNLEYLHDRTLEIFPDSSIALLLCRGMFGSYKKYINMKIDITNLYIPSYFRGDTNFASNERYLWYASVVLSALWIEYSLNNYTFKWFSADGPNKAAIDADSSSSAPSNWYTGYGVLINDNDVDEHNAIWYRNYLFTHYYGITPSNYPFELEYYYITTAGGTGIYAGLPPASSASYPLQNKPFWTATDLNYHEQTIANTYRLMSNYGE